jgi:DNA polymerase III delta prime subunit
LFSGPEGIGKRTLAVKLARELVAGSDPDAHARLDRGVHDHFLLYQDLEKPYPVRRGDLLGPRLDEEALLAVYEALEKESWIRGVTPVRGPDVIDLLERNPEKFTGRKGIPFAEVLERELAALSRSKGTTPAHLAVARRLFAVGPSQAPYRRSIGIELINGKGDGALYRNVSSLLRTSSSGGWRVAVFDDAHKMTDAAENAFLKTLEEPPPRSLLILVTSEPLSLLPTTLSRCVPFAFDAVPPAMLHRFLVESQGVSEADATISVALAQGSVARALELRGLDFAKRSELLEEILPAVAEGDLGSVLSVVGHRLAISEPRGRDRDAERGEARFFLELLSLCFRDFILVQSVPEASLVSGLDRPRSLDLARRRPIGDWERLFARTEEALSDIRASVEPRLAVEALFAEALPVQE